MRNESKHPEVAIFDGPVARKRSILKESLHLLKKNRLAFAGLSIFILFFVTAIIGLILTSGSNPLFDPSIVRLQEKLLPPLSKPNVESLLLEEMPKINIYIFGTDDLGRDVFARMLQGAWVSLTVGFVAVGISVLIGIFMGGVSGYFGQDRLRIDHIIIFAIFLTGLVLIFLNMIIEGVLLASVSVLYMFYSRIIKKNLLSRNKTRWAGFIFQESVSIDTLIMRFVDIMLCFPGFFLILTVVALLPASIYNIMAVIGLTSWMGTARFVRAEFLSLREQDFVTAARALGVKDRRIIFRHMLPNAIAPVLVSATIGIATAILTEAGLSFLGFGVPPPHATWGNILSDGKRFIFDAPWLTFIPGFAILIVVLSFNLFGEGLRDILNPKLRERY